MGTACDTWATGLGGSRDSPGDNGSFCPAHKFSGKERIPGLASAACTMLAAPGPAARACHGARGALRPLHCLVPSTHAAAGSWSRVQTFYRGLAVWAEAPPQPGT